MARILMLGGVNHPHVEHLALAMAERGFDVCVGGDALGELPASVLPANGVRTYTAPKGRRGLPLGAAAHVRWIRWLLRREQPDVVHAHWLPGYAFLAALAGAEPLVAMAWGSDVLRARALQTLANRYAGKHAALGMADSQALMDRCIQLGAAPKDCVLVNWGVDVSTFRPAEDRAALRG